ncbi:hypothetical protein [Aquisphaera insulae]|uniref:hypothetical protein n=1 Tax=Aquisphaera insulae TaxID=2712864 RepID=UPI0013ED074A|nr:hypothetical protein [Aquisphaera insulae]
MTPSGFSQFLNGMPWFAWIAIVAIVCNCINQIVAQSQKHFERIEMIRHGMNPDDRAAGTPEKWQEAEV